MTRKSNRFRIEHLLAELPTQPTSGVGLDELARQFGSSAFHFHRLFKESTGETPRGLIERVRLERAFMRLALTDSSVAEVGESVGFDRHETFTRAFKRRFGKSPSEFRVYFQAKRTKQLRDALAAQPPQCRLSEVRFQTLPATFILAKRRVGEYARFQYAPFTESDLVWNSLASWAKRHRVSYSKVAWGFLHDTPGLTPPEAQRFDACIRLAREIPSRKDLKCMKFEGGVYAMIDHIGSAATLDSSYGRLIAEIDRAKGRFTYRDAPSIRLFRAVHIGGDPKINHTTVCVAVAGVKNRKNRQSPTTSVR